MALNSFVRFSAFHKNLTLHFLLLSYRFIYFIVFHFFIASASPCFILQILHYEIQNSIYLFITNNLSSWRFDIFKCIQPSSRVFWFTSILSFILNLLSFSIASFISRFPLCSSFLCLPFLGLQKIFSITFTPHLLSRLEIWGRRLRIALYCEDLTSYSSWKSNDISEAHIASIFKVEA